LPLLTDILATLLASPCKITYGKEWKMLTNIQQSLTTYYELKTLNKTKGLVPRQALFI